MNKEESLIDGAVRKIFIEAINKHITRPSDIDIKDQEWENNNVLDTALEKLRLAGVVPKI